MRTGILSPLLSSQAHRRATESTLCQVPAGALSLQEGKLRSHSRRQVGGYNADILKLLCNGYVDGNHASTCAAGKKVVGRTLEQVNDALKSHDG